MRLMYPESNTDNAHKTYIDVDIQTPRANTPNPEDIIASHIDVDALPAPSIHKDAAVGSRRPEPGPPESREMGTSPIRHKYVDVYISKTPEPERPQPKPLLRCEIGTSPMKQAYITTGTSSRTPEPSSPPRRFVSAGSMLAQLFKLVE